jgi:predicted Rossmann-fold nucleotide-binding protein
MDDGKALMTAYPDFDIRIVHRERGIKLELVNAPASAFVDGRMIRGMREHLFAALRDILFTSAELALQDQRGEHDSVALTDLVFHTLRNANVLQTDLAPNLVVCWGGHSISRTEYEYTKRVGYQMGLRELDICTGCGPGAMKGPMKGATIAHAKQRIADARYIGVTEPGIIAAEAPNPIVSDLVIMPDIEKRLEAFIRLGHGVIVFPGGVGTVEEILYLLGVLSHPDNVHSPQPVRIHPTEPFLNFAPQQAGAFRLRPGEPFRQRYRFVVFDGAPDATRLDAIWQAWATPVRARVE